MVKLSSASQRKLERYVEREYLPSGLLKDIQLAKSRTRLIHLLRDALSINEITSPRVWIYIIQIRWRTIEDIFDRNEIILLREILRNEGVVVRMHIQDTLLNQYLTTKATQGLEDEGIVDVIKLNSNEKIILIHPKLCYEIYHETINK